jgi:hypothetical protein
VNPRIARIHGGTRNFPRQAPRQVMLTYGIVAGLFLLLFIFTRFLRMRALSSAIIALNIEN